MSYIKLIVLLLLITSCANGPRKNEVSESIRKQSAAVPQLNDEALDDTAVFAQDLKDEVTVGQGIAARLLGSFGYNAQREDLEKFITLVGLSIAAHSGRPEIQYRFAILETDEVNAYATPGGYIFITRGLLKNIHSEHELACVLGHEIAHVNLKHMYKDLKNSRKISTGEVLVRVLSKGGADIGGALTQLVSKGMKMLVEEGLGKEKEAEADQVGIMYAAAAGYDPNAFVKLIERLEGQERKGDIGKTHPHGIERITVIKKSIKENGLITISKKNSAVLERRFSEAIKQL